METHGRSTQFDVTIAGEINLDLVLDGIADPMPVERELLASAFRITLGSSAAILAHNLSALGARVGFREPGGPGRFFQNGAWHIWRSARSIFPACGTATAPPVRA